MVVNTKSLKIGIIARTHKSPYASFITSITYMIKIVIEKIMDTHSNVYLHAET